MVQSQNYSIWYLESGTGKLINNEVYFEQKMCCKLPFLLAAWYSKQNWYCLDDFVASYDKISPDKKATRTWKPWDTVA